MDAWITDEEAQFLRLLHKYFWYLSDYRYNAFEVYVDDSDLGTLTLEFSYKTEGMTHERVVRTCHLPIRDGFRGIENKGRFDLFKAMAGVAELKLD